MDRKLQRHRADSLRQHGFLVIFLKRKKAIAAEIQFLVGRRSMRSYSPGVGLLGDLRRREICCREFTCVEKPAYATGRWQ